jgi:hypothetical protein
LAATLLLSLCECNPHGATETVTQRAAAHFDPTLAAFTFHCTKSEV